MLGRIPGISTGVLDRTSKNGGVGVAGLTLGIVRIRIRVEVFVWVVTGSTGDAAIIRITRTVE
jgi:hypothetical protein